MRSSNEFERRGRTFKTCNKCSSYYLNMRKRKHQEQYENHDMDVKLQANTNEIQLSMILDKLFTCVDIHDELFNKYRYIKELQQILLDEVREYFNSDSDVDD